MSKKLAKKMAKKQKTKEGGALDATKTEEPSE